MRPLIFLLVFAGSPSSAPEHAGRPDIVARTSWDPAWRTPPSITRYNAPLVEVLDAIVVHHSDFDPPIGGPGIRDYHLEVSKFVDIGYHFIIEKDGTILEGRAIDRLGAHAGQSVEANRAARRARPRGPPALDRARRLDPDHGAVGIVVDGWFGQTLPPPEQLEALVQLVGWLRTRYEIEPARTYGHREVRHRLVEDRGLTFTGPEKRCPGDMLQQVVGALRRGEARANDAYPSD